MVDIGDLDIMTKKEEIAYLKQSIKTAHECLLEEREKDEPDRENIWSYNNLMDNMSRRLAELERQPD